MRPFTDFKNLHSQFFSSNRRLEAKNHSFHVKMASLFGDEGAEDDIATSVASAELQEDVADRRWVGPKDA